MENLLDIDSVLEKIEEVASNRDGIAIEEALILRGYLPFTLFTNADGLIPTVLSPVNWIYTRKPSKG